MLRLAVLALLFCSGQAVAAGHALIVTNNRSLDLARPDLHYADDDGAKWAELFADLIGDDVTLLSELDVATRALHPRFADVAPPTRHHLDAAVSALRARLEADAERPRVVYLVFAGHGDVADGQGFLELADQRFTAADLEALVSALPAERIHIVMDACNAWFMLHPRKPGAKRLTREVVPGGLLDRHPNVGALLSTSAEAVAWEWSEIQSGIFSHVVRSGLRGPADANRDGRVSYREMDAWLAIAHAPIDNEAYRPRIFAKAPSADDGLLVYGPQSSARDVSLELAGARRVTVRDARGLRLLDAHVEAGAPLTLRLPVAALEVDELHASAPRPTITTIALPPTKMVIGSDGVTQDAAARGEGALFRKLFSEPFGSQSIERWAAAPRPESDAPYGVSQRDAERLGNVLQTGARIEHNSRMFGGVVVTGLGAVVTLGGLGVLLEDRGDDAQVVGWTILGAGALTLSAGLITTLVTGDLEDLAAEYALSDLTTESERARVVADFEGRLAEQATAYRRTRQIVGWATFAIGLVATGSGALDMSRDGFDGGSGAMIGMGVSFVGLGLWSALSNRNAIEETWQLYQDIREIPWEPGRGPTLRPVAGPIDGGFMVGVDGSF